MKRTLVISFVGLLALIVAVLLIVRSSPNVRTLSQAEFTTFVQSNLLAKVRVYYKPGQMEGALHEVRGTFYQTDAGGQLVKEQGIPTEFPFIARVQISPELELKLLRESTNFVAISPNPVIQRASEWLHLSKP
jgi:hypothetical protein